MKKLLFVLAIGAFAACNDSSTTESTGTSADTAAMAPADTSALAPVDTTSTLAPADTTAVDTAAKK